MLLFPFVFPCLFLVFVMHSSSISFFFLFLWRTHGAGEREDAMDARVP